MEGRYLYLHDTGVAAPRGFYVIDLQASGTLSVEVPLPVELKGLAAAGFRVFESLGARYFAVAGAEWTAAGDIGAGALQSSDTFFQAFHRTIAQGNVLQLRRMRPADSAESGAASDAALNRLWVFDKIPDDLNLVSLRSLIGDFDTPFGSTRQTNLQRDTAAGSFAELHMAESSIRRVTAELTPDPTGPAALTTPIEGVTIRRSIASAVSGNAARGSEAICRRRCLSCSISTRKCCRKSLPRSRQTCRRRLERNQPDAACQRRQCRRRPGLSPRTPSRCRRRQRVSAAAGERVLARARLSRDLSVPCRPRGRVCHRGAAPGQGARNP